MKSVALRRSRTAVALASSSLLALVCASSAHAHNYDIYHWDVLPQPGSNAPGPTERDPVYGSYQYTIVDENHSNRRFKWTVDTAHSTAVSYNLCIDWGYFEKVNLAAHQTTAGYFGHNSNWDWEFGDCTVVRGYTYFSSSLFNRNASIWL